MTHRLRSTVLALALASLALGTEAVAADATVPAADTITIAMERDGHNTTTTAVAPGAAVNSGKNTTVLTLAGAPNSTITLAPGTILFLDSAREADGTSLNIHLLDGTIQVDIGDKGVYSDVHTLSATLDVRVTGTLFVVERLHHDSDYVALIRGHVRVKLREDIAALLAGHQNDQVDLEAHQGIGGSVSGGLTAVDALVSRPQLPSDTGGPAIRDQGLTPSANGGWNTDQSQIQTTPGTIDITHSVTDEVSNQVTSSVTKNITEQVTQQVIQNTVVPTPGELSPPPGPPGH